MLERAPAGRDLYALVENFFQTSFTTDNALITEAVRRMLAAGGKRLRPRVALLAAESVGGAPAEHLKLAAYMELIHVATLIHDDVVDGAETRRGVNATAVDFGNRVSVLAGDYLFAWIFKNVTAAYQHPIPHVLSATLADITDGEVLQLRALGELATTLGDVRRRRGEEDRLALRRLRRMRRTRGGRLAVCGEGAARVRNGLRDRVPDARRPARPHRRRGGARQAGRQRPARAQDDRAACSGPRGRGSGNSAPTSNASSPAATIRASASPGSSPESKPPAACSKTEAVLAGYVERAKQSLAPLGNAPARSELVALADALL